MRTFLENEIIWIAAPDYPLAKQLNPTVAEVLRESVIVREIGAGSRLFMEQALRQLRIPPTRLNIVQEIPSPEATKRLVMAGFGIGFLFRVGG